MPLTSAASWLNRMLASAMSSPAALRSVPVRARWASGLLSGAFWYWWKYSSELSPKFPMKASTLQRRNAVLGVLEVEGGGEVAAHGAAVRRDVGLADAEASLDEADQGRMVKHL